jgi:hypothetical protein
MTQSNEGKKHADPDIIQRSKSKRHFILYIIIIFVFGGLSFFVLGVINRNKGNILNAFAEKSYSLTLIESKNNSVLAVENYGKIKRIIVIDSDSSNWNLISKSNINVGNPSLSVDGQYVAYIVGQNIEVVKTNGKERIRIESNEIKEEGTKKNIGDLKICPWTSLEWSSDNDKIAFFCCSSNNGQNSSGVIVSTFKDSNYELEAIAETFSKTSSKTKRQLKWSRPNEIMVLTPSTNNIENMVEKFSIKQSINF